MIVLILFFAAVVQGMTSFGFSLVALPLLALLLPLKSVVAMLVAYSLLINTLLLLGICRHVKMSLIAPLLLGATAGVPLGMWALSTGDNATLKMVAGLVIVVVASLMLRGFTAKLQTTYMRTAAVGFLSGIMQGSLSLSGPPVVFFLTNQSVDKMTFRATLTSYFLLLNIVTLPGMLTAAVIGQTELILIGRYVLVIPLGIVCGHLLSRRIDQMRFRQISLYLMLLAGLAAVLL